jgi:hypothetical protein
MEETFGLDDKMEGITVAFQLPSQKKRLLLPLFPFFASIN